MNKPTAIARLTLTIATSLSLLCCGGATSNELFDHDGGTPDDAGPTSNDGTVPDDGGPSDGVGGSDTDAPSQVNRCPVLHGPKMAEVPRVSGGTFCVDETEVTNRDYSEFLAATGGRFLSACEVNAPDLDLRSVPSATCGYDAVNKPGYPVACVQWCDADAFCKWAGKRLCGSLGGGANQISAFDKAASSAWYAACSTNGKYPFEYGSIQKGICNDVLLFGDGPRVAPVSAEEGCRSPDAPFSQIHDMSGNLAEWEDSCDAQENCLVRGGSYGDNVQDTACGAGAPTPTKSMARRSANERTGFRCCAD